MNETPIQTAVRLVGGQNELARRLGVRQSLVMYWIKTGKTSPVHAVGIEKMTGGQVTRHDLRPDVFGTTPEGVNGGKSASH